LRVLSFLRLALPRRLCSTFIEGVIMAKLCELSADIQSRLMSGQEPGDIARALEVPLYWVLAEIEGLDDESEGF
jgi:hypothetical protein